MTKKSKADLTKDLSPVEKERWDEQHTIEYVARIYSGGEHLRAGALAAEAQFSESELDDLKVLALGIVDHMPAEPGTVADKGSIQGDPVKREMDRYQIDESEVRDLQQQREDSLDPDAIRDKREEKPAGKPDNSGVDGPTLHREPFGGKGDHDGNGKVGGAKPATNKGTQDTETLKK